jgi:hypothetical protein
LLRFLATRPSSIKSTVRLKLGARFGESIEIHAAMQCGHPGVGERQKMTAKKRVFFDGKKNAPCSAIRIAT